MIVLVKTAVPQEHLRSSGLASGLGGTPLEDFSKEPLHLEFEINVDADGCAGTVRSVNGKPVLLIGG